MTLVKFVGGALILFCAGALLVWVVSPHHVAYPDTTSSTTQTYDSGVLGVVRLVPACAGSKAGGATCARTPYEATVTVTQEGSGSAYTSVATVQDGAFHFALPAGAYILSASGADASVLCTPVRVAVTSAGFTNADITCTTPTQ